MLTLSPRLVEALILIAAGMAVGGTVGAMIEVSRRGTLLQVVSLACLLVVLAAVIGRG